MTRTNAIVGITAALAIAAFTWWCIAPRDVTPNLDDTNANVGTPASSHVDRRTTTDRAPDPTAPTDRTLAAANDVLRVRIEGIDRDAPWDARLRLFLEGWETELRTRLHDEAARNVDADGRCSFDLPGWWQHASDRSWQFLAHCDGYHVLDRESHGELDASSELVLRVRPKPRLRGRVVDARGEPHPAVVGIHVLRDGVPIDEPDVTARTAFDGSWSAIVPSASTYVVTARSRVDTGAPDRGSLAARIEPVTEWPKRMAITRVTPSATTTVVPDLVLRDGIAAKRHVRWPDGTPVAGLLVRIAVATDERLAEPAKPTSRDGSFLVTVDPMSTTRLLLGGLDSDGVVGGPFAVDLDPAKTDDIVLPAPVTLHATFSGILAGACVEVENRPRALRLENFTARVLPTTDVRVRIVASERRSAWRTIGPADVGTTIDFEIPQVVAEPPPLLELVTPPERMVAEARIDWRRSDGTTGSTSLRRADETALLGVRLSPGRYDVLVSPTSTGMAGKYLVPFATTVEIGDAPVRIAVPVVYGGKLSITVVDPEGARPAARCRVFDTDGTELRGRFADANTTYATNEGYDDGGELVPDVVNRFHRVLAPGDHDIVVECPGFATHRQRVTIRECEVANVRVRL